jgi:hypothetical protein
MNKEEWLKITYDSHDKLKEKFKYALELTRTKNMKHTLVLENNGNCYVTNNYSKEQRSLDFISFENLKEEIEKFESDLDFWFEIFFETFIERIELTL